MQLLRTFYATYVTIAFSFKFCTWYVFELIFTRWIKWIDRHTHFVHKTSFSLSTSCMYIYIYHQKYTCILWGIPRRAQDVIQPRVLRIPPTYLDDDISLGCRGSTLDLQRTEMAPLSLYIQPPKGMERRQNQLTLQVVVLIA